MSNFSIVIVPNKKCTTDYNCMCIEVSIDHVRDKAWSSCYLEFPFHSRNFCFVFEGKSTKEMRLKPRVVWRF